METLLASLVDTADAACIKCGFCLPKCPTYRETGHESASPRGRIHLMKLVAKGRLRPDEIYAQLDGCLGCRACETACPADVKFGKLLEAGREQILDAKPLPWLRHLGEWMFYAGVLPYLKRLDLAVDLLWVYQASGAQWLVRRSCLLHLLSERVAEWEQLLPRIPSPRLRQSLREVTPAEGHEQRRVGFLASGFNDYGSAEHGIQPRRFIHRPWELPGGPPAGYPPPLVTPEQGRLRALDAFARMRATEAA